MEKGRFYERFFMKVVMEKDENVMIKDKKIQYKRYNINKNKFSALHEVDNSNVTSSF